MTQPATITITTAQAAGVAELEAKGVVNLTRAEVRQIMRASETAVDEWIGSKQLPSFKAGRKRLIPIAGFKKFIAKLMRETD